MLFRIKRSYRSLMTAEQIRNVLEYLAAKESGVWVLKGKVYDVKMSETNFSVKKRGGSMSGAIYPVIKGKITQNELVQIDLDIKPAYYLILFSTLTSLILLFFIISDENMTMDGVYRSVTIFERFSMALFVIAVPAIISYFKTIKPVQDAEKWLMREMKLTPLD